LDVVPGPASPSLPFVANDTFKLTAGGRGYPVHLGESYPAPIAAVRSPDGRYILYTMGHRDGPSNLMLLDLATGSTRLFHGNASDPTWGHDGRIAYLSRPGHGAPSQVLVQDSLGGAPVAWATGKYTPLMWAGDQLFVDLGFDPRRLEVADSPGQIHEIPKLVTSPDQRETSDTVVALSPSGELALVDVQEKIGRYVREVLTLVRVADRRVISRLLMPESDAGLAADGYWSGDQIVAANSAVAGGGKQPPGLTTVGVEDGQLRVLSRFDFTYRGKRPMAQNMPYVQQPRFLGESGHNQVGLWATELGPIGVAYAECDLTQLHCVVGPPVAGKNATDSGFVSNPSRP
jgi:hypothetical protein